MMTEKELRKALQQGIYQQIAHIGIVWQKRPYTAVNVMTNIGGTIYEETAFAKCRWPDKWDPEAGVDLARRKVSAALARKVIEYVGYENSVAILQTLGD